jgi:hypothetical protein
MFGNAVKLYTTGGALVTLSSAGIGQLSLDVIRTLSPQKSLSIAVEDGVYTTGQSVYFRAADGDSLPSPLVADTEYFFRRLTSGTFAVYDTEAHARDEDSTTGRVEFVTSGNSSTSTFFIDALESPVKFRTVGRIEKPITTGTVSLYAFDPLRTNNLSLIGQYSPSETNPAYRRIRIGVESAWVRVLYRPKPPVIRSRYDYIPVEQERAVISAVHAVDLEDKDFADQSTRYWSIAFAYLKAQQEYIDGHAALPPQVNNLTYGDGEDPIMS